MSAQANPIASQRIHVYELQDEIQAREKLREKQRARVRALETLRQKDPSNIQKIVRPASVWCLSCNTLVVLLLLFRNWRMLTWPASTRR
jgi:hypothetical protein